ncbi:MAG: hypothetical protein ACLP9L_05580 [Thermoguttaceae bacterium]
MCRPSLFADRSAIYIVASDCKRCKQIVGIASLVDVFKSVEAAETNADFRAEIPAFVAEIKTIFEPWQLRECLEKARQTEPFDPADYEPDEDYEGEDPETIEMLRQDDIRHCTRDLLMVERAREWLLGDDAG